MYAYSL